MRLKFPSKIEGWQPSRLTGCLTNLNKIWTFIITISLCLLMFAGADKALPAMLTASNEALSLSVKLTAVYAVWLGIIRIVEETGISNVLAKILRPFIRFLFGKDLKPDTEKYISVWMSSNLFGMGNAATPMAISAIESMDDKSGRATDGMIMLFVLSASGFQLIPTTVISLRAAAGSANPGDIILPVLITALTAAAVGVLAVKAIQKMTRKNIPLNLERRSRDLLSRRLPKRKRRQRLAPRLRGASDR